MRTLSDVNKQFSEELKKLQEQYRESLEELLKEHGLDNGVTRIEDGKEGILVVERDFYRRLGYELKFYPTTKAGKVSKRADGYVCFPDFKPKER